MSQTWRFLRSLKASCYIYFVLIANSVGAWNVRNLPVEALKPHLSKPIRFMFVREPYGRLISAYVDKLLSPNELFWDYFGRYSPVINKSCSNILILYDLDLMEMNWIEVVTFIPPFIRSVTHLKVVHSTYHRPTSGLPTWLEQSKDTYSWSTSSFPAIIYLDTYISFLSLTSIFFLPLQTYCHLHIYCACWVSVCNRHSLNINYYGITFGGVPGSFNSVADRMHVWPVVTSVYSPFRTTKQWGTSPLLKGITQWATEIVHFVFTTCASTVSLAPTRLQWFPRHLSDLADQLITLTFWLRFQRSWR